MRSKLFVPASRPELFAKALASSADAISFDLEDAVEPGSKARAREELAKLFASAGDWRRGKTIVVRINGNDTPHFGADLGAVVRPGVDMVNLPMVEDPRTIQQTARLLEQLEHMHGIGKRIGILANIESPRGLRQALEFAMADTRVAGLQIGYGDLFAPLGIVSGEPSAMQVVRVAVRLAAGEAGIPAYDGAYVHIDDPQGYLCDARAAQQLGFAGKSCIHPSQVALANEAFMPGEADIAHALRVVEAARDAQAQGKGAFVVDGRLVDGPFITRAQQLVTLASRLGMVTDTPELS